MASKFLKNPNGGVYKDSNGKLVKVDLSLPTLSNPATAEDIASGKEAYGDDGVAMTGTASSSYAMAEGTITLPSRTATSIKIEGIPKEPIFIICYCGSGEFINTSMSQRDTIVWWSVSPSSKSAYWTYVNSASSTTMKGNSGASYDQWAYADGVVTLYANYWTNQKTYSYRIFY